MNAVVPQKKCPKHTHTHTIKPHDVTYALSHTHTHIQNTYKHNLAQINLVCRRLAITIETYRTSLQLAKFQNQKTNYQNEQSKLSVLSNNN